MKLEKCLEIGKKNGKKSLHQCVLYVEFNANKLFGNNTIVELNELYADLKEKKPEYFYENYSCKR
jgi:hypothetical protein